MYNKFIKTTFYNQELTDWSYTSNNLYVDNVYCIYIINKYYQFLVT